jgi:signal transduction histidine kinase/phage shock protein PspC (stress-responsive transcriptional regulator)
MHSNRLSFARRDDHRVLAGVASGFADQHGLPVSLVRAALVVLTLAGGLGLLLYAVGAVASAPSGTPMPAAHPHDASRIASVVCIAAGLMLVVRSSGVWLGDEVMVPLVVVVAGIAVFAPDSGDGARARLLGGAALVALGLVLVGTNGGVSSNVRTGTFATALTVLGVAVLLGPWLTRLARDAAEDRRQRIRLNEREAMAAHLHDSVLQTLALIQRTADDPRRTVSLARQQERDLREWLYGTPDAVTGNLSEAMRAMVGDVETTYDVTIELVMVGDVELTDTHAALVAAAREACVNAAKHSGVVTIAVYAEVGVTDVECWVRDRGIGFQQANASVDPVNSGRRGIADSIEARLARHGGTAHIESIPGAGTEVHLIVPRPVGAQTVQP